MWPDKEWAKIEAKNFIDTNEVDPNENVGHSEICFGEETVDPNTEANDADIDKNEVRPDETETFIDDKVSLHKDKD